MPGSDVVECESDWRNFIWTAIFVRQRGKKNRVDAQANGVQHSSLTNKQIVWSAKLLQIMNLLDNGDSDRVRRVAQIIDDNVSENRENKV